MLLCASKFATAKIERIFEMGKKTPLGVPFILLLMFIEIILDEIAPASSNFLKL